MPWCLLAGAYPQHCCLHTMLLAFASACCAVLFTRFSIFVTRCNATWLLPKLFVCFRGGQHGHFWNMHSTVRVVLLLACQGC
jgi:hypothetical protein